MQQELERLRREAREMKSAEAQVKFNMRREEQKQKKLEKDRDAQELLEWRSQQRDEAIAYSDYTKRQQRAMELEDRQNFHEYKRVVREVRQAELAQEIHEEYVSAKESSEYRVEMQRIEQEEERRELLEARKETIRTLSAAKADEKAREDREEQEARDANDQAEMEHQMMLAQRERDQALVNLESVRAHLREPLPDESSFNLG